MAQTPPAAPPPPSRARARRAQEMADVLMADVGPAWLVSDATAHSKAEHQRNVRVNADETARRRKPEKDDKNKGGY